MSIPEQMKADKEKIKDLLKSAEYLTDWESTFIASISGRLDRLIPLSEKQSDVLDKIIKQVAERYD